MSLALLVPAALVALAALAIPLLIHLVRRPEQTAIDFAALRWMSERRRPRRRLRLDDLLLLALRLLLLAALALLLAQPVLDGRRNRADAWIVVVPGVDLPAARAALADVEGEWRWLAPDFPRVEDGPADPPPAVASLLRELDARLAAQAALHVVVPHEIAGLDGERIRLRREVEWHVAAATPVGDGATPADEPVLRVAVRHAPEQTAALRYLRAAFAAMNVHAPASVAIDEQPLDMPFDASTDVLVWLGAPLSTAAAGWTARGGRTLVVDSADAEGRIIARDVDGHAFVRERRFERGALIALTRPLDAAVLPLLHETTFPEHLNEWLRGPQAAPDRADADAVRPGIGAVASSPPRTALDAPFAVFIALLFFVERLLATRRRERAA